MAKTSEEILKSITQSYNCAQATATKARNENHEDAAELQYYANLCYKRYQKVVALVNSGELEEAEKLLFVPVE